MKNKEWIPNTAMAELIYDIAGYKYDEANDGFTARTNPPLQSNMGYTCFYDLVSPYASMIIDCAPITFEYDGCKWLVEMWKGQYGILTGCEIGFYVHPNTFDNSLEGTAVKIIYELLDVISTSAADLILSTDETQQYTPEHKLFYCCLGENELAKVLSSYKKVSNYIDGISFKLNKNGKTICSYTDKQQFWVNGFEIEKNVSHPSDLEVVYEFKFNDDGFRDAFFKALRTKYPNNTNVDSWSFTFKSSEGIKPYNRKGINEKLITKANEKLLSYFNEYKQKLHIPSNNPNDFLIKDDILAPFFIAEMAGVKNSSNKEKPPVSLDKYRFESFLTQLSHSQIVSPFAIDIVETFLNLRKYDTKSWEGEYEKFASMMKDVLKITDIKKVGNILKKLDFPQEKIGKIFCHVYRFSPEDILKFFNIKYVFRNITDIINLLDSFDALDYIKIIEKKLNPLSHIL